jgi:hypothetical protein
MKNLRTPLSLILGVFTFALPGLQAQTNFARLVQQGVWPEPLGGSVIGMTVVSNRAYLGYWPSSVLAPELSILDLSDPMHPTRLGRYVTRDVVSKVRVAGNYAYVSEGISGNGTNDPGIVEIVDVGNAAVPTPVAHIDTPGRVTGVRVVGDYAYIAEGSRWTGTNDLAALEIFNVSNPASPLRVARYETNRSFFDVEVAGHYAYVAGGGVDFQVLDVSDPANPIWLGSYNTNVDTGYEAYGFKSIALQAADNRLYSVGENGFQVLDISIPATPVPVGGIAFPLTTLHVAGQHACVASELPKARFIFAIFDVSVAGDPVGLGDSETRWLANAIHIGNDHVYVAGGRSGFLIFSLEVKPKPSITSVSRTGGKLILNWNGASGLRVQHTSCPEAPVWDEVPDSEGRSRMELDIGPGPEFFRLVQLGEFITKTAP